MNRLVYLEGNIIISYSKLVFIIKMLEVNVTGLDSVDHLLFNLVSSLFIYIKIFTIYEGCSISNVSGLVIFLRSTIDL